MNREASMEEEEADTTEEDRIKTNKSNSRIHATKISFKNRINHFFTFFNELVMDVTLVHIRNL